MMKMFAQMFAMLNSFFTAGEILGKAGVHMAEWAENSANTLKTEAIIENQRKLEIARANAALPIPAQQAVIAP